MRDLDLEIEKTRTVFTNLNSFKDWSFAAYKVEEHEKDVVITAVKRYLDHLNAQKEKGVANDSTEVCE